MHGIGYTNHRTAERPNREDKAIWFTIASCCSHPKVGDTLRGSRDALWPGIPASGPPPHPPVSHPSTPDPAQSTCRVSSLVFRPGLCTGTDLTAFWDEETGPLRLNCLPRLCLSVAPCLGFTHKQPQGEERAHNTLPTLGCPFAPSCRAPSGGLSRRTGSRGEALALALRPPRSSPSSASFTLVCCKPVGICQATSVSPTGLQSQISDNTCAQSPLGTGIASEQASLTHHPRRLIPEKCPPSFWIIIYNTRILGNNDKTFPIPAEPSIPEFFSVLV